MPDVDDKHARTMLLKHWCSSKRKLSNKYFPWQDTPFPRHFSHFWSISWDFPDKCQIPWHSRFSKLAATLVHQQEMFIDTCTLLPRCQSRAEPSTLLSMSRQTCSKRSH